MPGVHVLPEVDELTAPFWQSGRDGVLRMQRCAECRHWVHPPKPRCNACMSPRLAYEATAGTATVWSYTVNRQQWMPDLDVPYTIAIVELPEQPGLRMTTRLVGIEPEAVSIGMPVSVEFESVEDIFLPFFRPSVGGDASIDPAEGSF